MRQLVLTKIKYFQVTLTVDDQYKERWTSPGTFNMLASAQVYVGGSPGHMSLRQQNKGAFLFQKSDLPPNFVGCLKKVSICVSTFVLLGGQG